MELKTYFAERIFSFTSTSFKGAVGIFTEPLVLLFHAFHIKKPVHFAQAFLFIAILYLLDHNFPCSGITAFFNNS